MKQRLEPFVIALTGTGEFCQPGSILKLPVQNKVFDGSNCLNQSRIDESGGAQPCPPTNQCDWGLELCHEASSLIDRAWSTELLFLLSTHCEAVRVFHCRYRTTGRGLRFQTQAKILSKVTASVGRIANRRRRSVLRQAFFHLLFFPTCNRSDDIPFQIQATVGILSRRQSDLSSIMNTSSASQNCLYRCWVFCTSSSLHRASSWNLSLWLR